MVRSFVFALAMAAIMIITGCTNVASKEYSISISCDDFGRQNNISRDISVGNGDKILINLCSNRTTGFSWNEKAQISNPQVIEQISYKWVAPADTGKVGVAGEEQWVFMAVKQGTGNISMQYGRPWAGGEKAAWTFTLHVNVK